MSFLVQEFLAITFTQEETKLMLMSIFLILESTVMYSTVIQPYLQDFVLYFPFYMSENVIVVVFTNRFSQRIEHQLSGRKCCCLECHAGQGCDCSSVAIRRQCKTYYSKGISRSFPSIENKLIKTIVGSFDFWYLDCGRGQWLDFGPEVSDKFYPFLDYCNPLKNWRLIYSYDPLFNLTSEEASLIIGGEVHLWAEQTDQHNIERMLWPRVSAAGHSPRF